MGEADRIKWHCRRGMLELDLVLTAFVERAYGRLEGGEIDAFRRLLEYPDQELLDFVMGRSEPEDDAVRGVLEQMRNA